MKPTDRLSAQERAAKVANSDDLARFQKKYDAHIQTLSSLGCGVQGWRIRVMEIELNRLYLMAGYDPDTEDFDLQLSMHSETACTNQRLGRVSDADLGRLSKMREAAYADCNNRGAIASGIKDLRETVTKYNYIVSSELFIRKIFEYNNRENMECLVRSLTDELLSR